MYLVTLCNDNQAPSCRGRYSRGVAKVLSTMRRVPTSLHLLATSFTSTTLARGLVIVSTRTNETRLLILAIRSSVSGPARIVFTPNLERLSARSCVVPYDSFVMTIVSPEARAER